MGTAGVDVLAAAFPGMILKIQRDTVSAIAIILSLSFIRCKTRIEK